MQKESRPEKRRRWRCDRRPIKADGHGDCGRTEQDAQAGFESARAKYAAAWTAGRRLSSARLPADAGVRLDEGVEPGIALLVVEVEAQTGVAQNRIGPPW